MSMWFADIDHASVKRLAAKVTLVEADKRSIAALSHSERIAVALVLNKPRFIEGHDTILDAIDRLGIDDLKVCMWLRRCRQRAHG